MSPDRLDFGPLARPEARDQVVVIRNEGNAPEEECTLSGLQLSDASDAAFTLPGGPIERQLLKAGEELRVTVRALQPGSGELEGALEFHMAPSPHEFVSISLHASASTASCITVAPGSLDFGTIKLACSSAKRTFNVYNACSNEVVITGVRIQGAGQPAGGPDCPGTEACPEFKLVSAPAIPDGGLRLRSGEAPISFQVRYRPIDFGADVGSLSVDFETGGTPLTYLVPLAANGDSPSRKTDVFVDEPRPISDILLVIDNSPSMAGHQQTNAANFDGLLHYVLAGPFDFHLAVVTADPSGAAVFLSGPTHPETVLTRTTPDLAAKFAAKVNVGTGGRGSQTCLETGLAALSSPLIDAQNAGFLRSDAPLAVFCVSDSNDQSPLPVGDYLNGFWALKGLERKGLFSFFAVGGFSASCPGDTGALAEAVTLSNGLKADICDPDWFDTVFKPGTPIPWYERTQYFLTSTPDTRRGPIEIAIDGQPVAPVTQTGETVWSYDSMQNAIRFDPMHKPPAGKPIEITYWTVCYQ